MDSVRERFRRTGLATKAVVFLGLVLVSGLLVFGGIFALGTVYFYDSYASSYEYEVSISVDEEIVDGEFLLPLPILADEPTLGEIHTTDSDRFDGIETGIVETDHGPMFQLEVAFVSDAPSRHDLWVVAEMDAEQPIETRNPHGNEPLLSPLELRPRHLDDDAEDGLLDRQNFDASSTAHLEHGGEESADIGVLVTHRGGNEWWSFGWNGNWYETTVLANEAPHGPEGEWIELRGSHTEGAGSYPRVPPAPR